MTTDRQRFDHRIGILRVALKRALREVNDMRVFDAHAQAAQRCLQAGLDLDDRSRAEQDRIEDERDTAHLEAINAGIAMGDVSPLTYGNG